MTRVLLNPACLPPPPSEQCASPGSRGLTSWSVSDSPFFHSDRAPDTGNLFFPLGRGHVIKGWDEGLQGIKVRWTSLHSAFSLGTTRVCATQLALSVRYTRRRNSFGLRRMCENVLIYARMKKLENAHVLAGERDSYTHDSLGPGLRRVGNAW